MFLLKSKKQNEFSTSDGDPFNPEVFPEEIREEILSFLGVKHLLEASLVSRLWSTTIGSSLCFKRKVMINLHSWDESAPSAIADSDRSYENLTVAEFKTSSTKLLSLRKKNWRRVTLSVGKISSQKSFIKLMETFEAVKNLKILSTNIRELNTNKKLTLVDLERLVLSDVTLDLFDVFIANQPSLKSLSLRFISCDILSPRRTGEAIVEFLALNQTLKDLEMNHLVTNDLFVANVAPKLPLKLRSLTIGLDETSQIVQENIEYFLRSQGDNVEHLKLILHQKFVKKGPNEWGYWERGNNVENDRASDEISMIFNVWNSLTSLKSLFVRFLQNSSEIVINRELLKSLKRNVNVTIIFIQFMNINAPSSIIIELMKLCPNLRVLYVSKLIPAIVRYAAINLIALRELKCFKFEGECLQEFNDLKVARSDVNKFIVINDRCAFG